MVGSERKRDQKRIPKNFGTHHYSKLQYPEWWAGAKLGGDGKSQKKIFFAQNFSSLCSYIGRFGNHFGPHYNSL
jgi:hypothetical protein